MLCLSAAPGTSNRFGLMPNQLPEQLIPHLEKVNKRMFRRGIPLDFWRAESIEHVVGGFMDLAGILKLAIIDGESPDTWPTGYRMLMVLFDWEASAQSDGWSQYYESSDEQIKGVCALYKLVGLEAEAKSIERAHKVASHSSDDNVVAAAYDALRHDYSMDLDRIEYLAAWFRDNADFYLYKV